MANFNTHWVVRNTAGSSRFPRQCSCTSWIKHWKAATGSTRIVCARWSCGDKAVDGAHVQIMDGRASKEWYIVPFCADCNRSKHKDWMFLKRNVELVPIAPLDTCGRYNGWV
jgi:hypothetical protein